MAWMQTRNLFGSREKYTAHEQNNKIIFVFDIVRYFPFNLTSLVLVSMNVFIWLVFPPIFVTSWFNFLINVQLNLARRSLLRSNPKVLFLGL